MDSFLDAIKTSKRVRNEIKKADDFGYIPNPTLKPNSIYFLWTIFRRLENLEFITFKVNDDKHFTRLIKNEKLTIKKKSEISEEITDRVIQQLS